MPDKRPKKFWDLFKDWVGGLAVISGFIAVKLLYLHPGSSNLRLLYISIVVVSVLIVVWCIYIEILRVKRRKPKRKSALAVIQEAGLDPFVNIDSLPGVSRLVLCQRLLTCLDDMAINEPVNWNTPMSEILQDSEDEEDLILAITERLGIPFEKGDYSKIETFGKLVRFCEDRLNALASSGNPDQPAAANCLSRKIFIEIRSSVDALLRDHGIKLKPSTRLNAISSPQIMQEIGHYAVNRLGIPDPPFRRKFLNIFPVPSLCWFIYLIVSGIIIGSSGMHQGTLGLLFAWSLAQIPIFLFIEKLSCNQWNPVLKTVRDLVYWLMDRHAQSLREIRMAMRSKD